MVVESLKHEKNFIFSQNFTTEQGALKIEAQKISAQNKVK
jgi:hypothetical protein